MEKTETTLRLPSRVKWVLWSLLILVVLAAAALVGWYVIHFRNYNAYRDIPVQPRPYAEGSEFVPLKDELKAVPGFALAAENDDLALYIRESTAEIALYHKESGKTVYSNPQEADKDPVAKATNLENLKSQFILSYLDGNAKYLIIGKPCDIRTLRNYAKIDVRVETVFPYMFSFFCMGVPSEKANIKLMEALGVSPRECTSLKYRGNGWPGSTVVIDKNGNTNTMSYNESWGGILGRDLKKYCKFCMDGLGDPADISCGDAWYLDADKKPVFDESDGRNIVFARTSKGSEILTRAAKMGYIECSSYDNLDELRFIQKSQYARKELMLYRQLAMMMLFKNSPRYKLKYLKQYSQNVPIANKVDAFVGTVSRIVKGKL